MSRFRQLCALIAIGIVAQLAFVQPAQAHDPFGYYIHWWPDYIFIPTYFDESYPTGAWRSRVIDGASQWNNATSTGIEPDFSNFGTRIISDAWEPFSNPCAQQAGILVVHYEDLDPWSTGALGGTFDCTNWVTQQYLSSTVVVDNDQSWYTGTGDVPGTQYDLWSLTSHELGHATGFYIHLPNGEPFCGRNSGQHTMCPKQGKGEEWGRTLNTHDIHTFDAAY